jgi:uncharacterized protein YneF (UPF0154 family)
MCYCIYGKKEWGYMPWWAGLIIGILALIIGGVIGFIITRKVIAKQLKDNPPINENQIRAMYRSMGRKPSEAEWV